MPELQSFGKRLRVVEGYVDPALQKASNQRIRQFVNNLCPPRPQPLPATFAEVGDVFGMDTNAWLNQDDIGAPRVWFEEAANSGLSPFLPPQCFAELLDPIVRVRADDDVKGQSGTCIDTDWNTTRSFRVIPAGTTALSDGDAILRAQFVEFAQLKTERGLVSATRDRIMTVWFSTLTWAPGDNAKETRIRSLYYENTPSPPDHERIKDKIKACVSPNGEIPHFYRSRVDRTSSSAPTPSFNGKQSWT